MVDVPNSISKYSLLYLFGFFSELVEIADVLLEVLMEELFWVNGWVPEGLRAIGTGLLKD